MADVDEALASEMGNARHERRASRKSFSRAVSHPRSPASLAASSGIAMDAKGALSGLTSTLTLTLTLPLTLTLTLTLTLFTRSTQVYLVEYGATDPPSLALERAESRLGEMGCDVFATKGVAFCAWCDLP